jgi:hypothetical protein
MDWLWFILYALGGVIAFYAIAALAVLIRGGRGGTVEMPGGETIFLPLEPERPRKRWRITIERH